jgi:hypothetical protein
VKCPSLGLDREGALLMAIWEEIDRNRELVIRGESRGPKIEWIDGNDFVFSENCGMSDLGRGPASRVCIPNIAKILYSYNWDVGKIIFLNIFAPKFVGSQYFFNLFYLFYFYWWNNSFTTFKILTEIWLVCLWLYSPAWNIYSSSTCY